MNSLRLAVLSLSRHKFSTIISIISIALSIACGGMLLRVYKLSTSRFSTMGNGGDAIVGAKAGGIDILLGGLNGEGPYPDFLPYKLYESLKAEQTVVHGDRVATSPSYIESIIPFLYFAKLDSYRVVGTNIDFFNRSRVLDSLRVAQGHLFSQRGEIVLGAQVAKKLKVQVGDSVPLQTWVGNNKQESALSLKVSGILEPTGSQWDRTLFSSVEQAQEVLQQKQLQLMGHSIWGPQVLNYFLIYLKPGGFAPLESLINQRTVGQVVLIQEQKERLQELTGVGKRIGLLVMGFIIALGGLSVGAMLVTRFEGMSKQIAVLRALGYTQRELFFWLFWEGLLLGAMGLFLGACLDGGALPVLRGLLGSAVPTSDLVASSVLESYPVWGIALLAIVGSVFIPILKMSKQDTHSSLRGL